MAAEHGLRIAFNAGGHNAGTIDWSRDTLLVKWERMRGIEIDANAQRARIEPGTLGKPLAVAAGEHGLAYLAGTSPDVGVFGYSLGGGLSWMIRKFGLACNSIVAAEAVTADGRLVRLDRDTEPELFWAIRGGGGNFAPSPRSRSSFSRSPRSTPAPCSGRSSAQPRSSTHGAHGSRLCPMSANRSAACCSSPTRSSCPTTCAGGRSR